jgi:hypothetical protein
MANRPVSTRGVQFELVDRNVNQYETNPLLKNTAHEGGDGGGAAQHNRASVVHKRGSMTKLGGMAGAANAALMPFRMPSRLVSEVTRFVERHV